MRFKKMTHLNFMHEWPVLTQQRLGQLNLTISHIGIVFIYVDQVIILQHMFESTSPIADVRRSEVGK